MLRRCSLVALALPLVILAGSFSGPADAQPGGFPRLRAALHELREARQELQQGRDGWPAGYRDRAIRAIDDAIESVRTILAVKDVQNFRGVERTADFYRRFADQPHVRAALHDLRDAREELRQAKADARGLRERAIDDIDVAIGEMLTMLRQFKR